jgi:LysM repeat protein
MAICFCIATKSKISLAELAELNNLKANSHVQLGQTLKVRLGQPNSLFANYIYSQSHLSYRQTVQRIVLEHLNKVQRGDTLSSIATKSKISLAELAELNNLKANSHVQLGQTLLMLSQIY